MYKKAFSSIVSLFFVLLITMLMLALILSIWSTYSERFHQKLEHNKMIAVASQTLDILVKNPGKPFSWEKTNPSIIGLASSDRILSPAKVDAFINLDYKEAKKLLGLPYDFYLILEDLNSTHIKEYGRPSAGKWVVEANRIVIYANKNSKARFGVWK